MDLVYFHGYLNRVSGAVHNDVVVSLNNLRFYRIIRDLWKKSEWSILKYNFIAIWVWYKSRVLP